MIISRRLASCNDLIPSRFHCLIIAPAYFNDGLSAYISVSSIEYLIKSSEIPSLIFKNRFICPSLGCSRNSCKYRYKLLLLFSLMLSSFDVIFSWCLLCSPFSKLGLSKFGKPEIGWSSFRFSGIGFARSLIHASTGKSDNCQSEVVSCPNSLRFRSRLR